MMSYVIVDAAGKLIATTDDRRLAEACFEIYTDAAKLSPDLFLPVTLHHADDDCEAT